MVAVAGVAEAGAADVQMGNWVLSVRLGGKRLAGRCWMHGFWAHAKLDVWLDEMRCWVGACYRKQQLEATNFFPWRLVMKAGSGGVCGGRL